MKILKRLTKKVIIYVTLIMIILSSIAPVNVYASRGYDSACGDYVSQYARDFIAKYCTPETNTIYVGVAYPEWTGGAEFQGKFKCCCSTGVWYMYKLALGINIYDYGFSARCSEGIVSMASSPNWEDVTNQTLQPGDIVICSTHTEMYIGNNENANFGNTPHSGKVTTGPRLGSDFTKAFRLKNTVQVDPSRKSYRNWNRRRCCWKRS